MGHVKGFVAFVEVPEPPLGQTWASLGFHNRDKAERKARGDVMRAKWAAERARRAADKAAGLRGVPNGKAGRAKRVRADAKAAALAARDAGGMEAILRAESVADREGILARAARSYGVERVRLRAAVDQVHAMERDERDAALRVLKRETKRPDSRSGKALPAELLQRELDAWKDRYCSAVGPNDRAALECEGVALFERLASSEGI